MDNLDWRTEPIRLLQELHSGARWWAADDDNSICGELPGTPIVIEDEGDGWYRAVVFFGGGRHEGLGPHPLMALRVAAKRAGVAL